MKLRSRLGVGIAFVAALLIGAASPASAWCPPGDYIFESTDIVSVLDLPGDPTLACEELVFETTLNAGTANTGTVNDGYAEPCTSSNDANCDVVVTFQNLPWGISGTGDGTGSGTVVITGVDFNVEYQGSLCSLQGLSFDVVGDVCGDYAYPAGTLTISSCDLEVANSNAPLVVPDTTAVDISGSATATTGPPKLEPVTP